MTADTCNLFAFDPVFGWPAPGEGPDPFPCDEPAAATITFACVHEHVDTPRSCCGCAADVQRCAPGLICPRCLQDTGSHDCPVEIRITWDDSPEEPVTVVQGVNCG